jgi:hypothetical protein
MIYVYIVESSFFLEFLNYHLIVVLGVHCDIYKSSYNIPQLNSPSPSFSFIAPLGSLSNIF